MSKFIFPLRVYYEDTDAGGVVYHANYLHFMERARTEFLISLNYHSGKDRGFIVNKIEIEYLHPARLYEQLEVMTDIFEIRGASIVFEQIIRSAVNPNVIFCRGLVKVVSVNKDLRPCRLPKELNSFLHY